MYQFVLIMHIIAAICIIVLVLVQQGKGATVGASFGAGASQTIFGSRGAGSFLLKLTLGFVLMFFGTSIALNWLSAHAVKQDQVQGSQLPAGLLIPEPVPTAPLQPQSLPEAGLSSEQTNVPAASIPPLSPTAAVPASVMQSTPAAESAVKPAAVKKMQTSAPKVIKKHHPKKKHIKKLHQNNG